MRCWNCNQEIPKGAKVCGHCEAAVEAEPTAEEMQAVRELLETMPAEVKEELFETMQRSATAEDFVNSIFVGDCPRCDSSKTGNCESDPEIQELLVGRCYDCGLLWCTECQKILDPKSPECPCWDEDLPFEDELDDEE